MKLRIAATLLATGSAVMLSGCGSDGSEQKYDIGPLVSVSKDACANYGGVRTGSFPNVSCLVTQAECKRANADWAEKAKRIEVTVVQVRCG